MADREAPISGFVQDYVRRDPLRLHMPGHKGVGPMGFEERDITEIPGADVLYQPEGIIRESEHIASRLFGSGCTVYSTEGSSLPIRAMLYLTALLARSRGERPRIAAGRNAHRVFITAAALLDVEVQWLYPESSQALTQCAVTPAALDAFLQRERPTAVYITSPDYLGDLADVGALAKICHERGVLLLVDNAHGAYLRFLPRSLHPMDLGADLCCDSAHKTLPVLTGGAYLHISGDAPAIFRENADRAMSLFASTSPSYLILQSLDRANAYLDGVLPEQLARAVPMWKQVRQELEKDGYDTSGQEPMKLTLAPKSRGWRGTELAEALEQQGIYVEFADPDYVVMMISPAWEESVSRRLVNALKEIPKRPAILEPIPELPHPERVLGLQEALFAPLEVLPTEESLGRIMGAPTVSCPPAIPIVSCGERIDETAIRAMQYYGMTKVTVVV